MKELTKQQIVSVFDALLCDGADNGEVTIWNESGGNSTKRVCGCGDKTLERGKYLIVWDSMIEDDQRFPRLYKLLQEQFDNGDADYDVLQSNEDGSIDCVIIFRLTSE